MHNTANKTLICKDANMAIYSGHTPKYKGYTKQTSTTHYTNALRSIYGSVVRSTGLCGRVPGAGAPSSSSGESGGSRRRTCPSEVGKGGPPMAIWGFRKER